MVVISATESSLNISIFCICQGGKTSKNVREAEEGKASFDFTNPCDLKCVLREVTEKTE